MGIEKEKSGVHIGTIATSPNVALAEKQRLKSRDILLKPLHLRSEVLTSSEITDEVITEAADLYRSTFNNAWGDYLVCTDCDSSLPEGMKVSPEQVFGKKEIISLEKMDNLTQFPCCPECDQSMEFFHDTARTRFNIKKKLKKDGYLSLMRDDEDNLLGYTFANGGRLEDIIKSEWGNQYHYTAQPNPKHDRDPHKLIHLLNEGAQNLRLTADTQALIWNCAVTDSRIRGGTFFKLTKNLFDAISQDRSGQKLIGECLSGSLSHRFFGACDAIDIDVDGYFGKGISVVFDVDRINERLDLGAEKFYALRKKSEYFNKKV